jgi:Leucine-rich repeat (LRR) protein
LTRLPPLNINLEILNCNRNRITCLPEITNGLEELYCSDNPIFDIIFNTYELSITRQDVKTLNNFRRMFYSLKYKGKFKRWLWNIRETLAMGKYSPANLEELLSQVEEEEFQEVLDTW